MVRGKQDKIFVVVVVSVVGFEPTAAHAVDLLAARK